MIDRRFYLISVVVLLFGAFGLSQEAYSAEFSGDLFMEVLSDPGGPYFRFSGTPIILDGSGSTDVDGIVEKYEWIIMDGGFGIFAEGVKPTIHPSLIGIHIVTLTVTDNDGLTDTTFTTIEISKSLVPDIRNLKDNVIDLSLDKPNDKSLTKKLDGAIKNLTNDDPTDDAEAVDKLQAFINQVKGLSQIGVISDSDEKVLIDSANEIINNLSE